MHIAKTANQNFFIFFIFLNLFTQQKVKTSFSPEVFVGWGLVGSQVSLFKQAVTLFDL